MQIAKNLLSQEMKKKNMLLVTPLLYEDKKSLFGQYSPCVVLEFYCSINTFLIFLIF